MRTAGPSRVGAAVFFSILAALMVAVLLIAFRDAPTPRAVAASPPPNDNFQDSVRWYVQYPLGVDVFPIDVSQTTVGATLEAGESAPCAPIGATEWFAYDGDRTGTVTLDTVGSNFDTVLAVYTFAGDFGASPPGGNLAPIVCDDNGARTQSRVSFTVEQGKQYLVQAGGRSGAAGQLHLHAECACSLPNDDLTRATDFNVGFGSPSAHSEVTTTGSGLEPGEPRPCGDIGATVWYRLYAQQAGTIELTTAGSSFATVIAAYTAPYYQGSPSTLTGLSCNQGAGGSRASLTLQVQQNQIYFFQAGGVSGATGRLVIDAHCVPACPPYNDGFDYGGANELPLVAQEQTDGATTQPGETLPCGGMGKTVWFGVILRGNARIAIDTGGSGFDTALAAYEQGSVSPPPGSLSLLSCKSAANGTQPRLTFDAVADHVYWVQLGGRNGASGDLHVNIDCTPGPCPPTSDNPQNTGLYLDPTYGFPFTFAQDTRGATTQPGEQLGCGGMARTVWLRLYSSEQETPIVISTTGSSFDTAIAVYQSPFYGTPNIDQLTSVACSAGGTGQQASLRFAPTAGATYFVQIGGRGEAGGDLKIHADCETVCPPPNDSVGRSYATGGTNFAFAENTRGATLEAGESRPCGNIGKTVWFNLPAQGDYAITTPGSSFRVAVALYAWEGVSPPGGLSSTACSASGSLDVRTQAGFGYLLQVGGVDAAGGDLEIVIVCTANCPDRAIGPDTGGECNACIQTGPVVVQRGGVRLPDTGSGGYLPGAGR